jgi:hypothetical protein
MNLDGVRQGTDTSPRSQQILGGPFAVREPCPNGGERHAAGELAVFAVAQDMTVAQGARSREPPYDFVGNGLV